MRELYLKELRKAAERVKRDVIKGRSNLFTTLGRGILDADKPTHLLSLHKREGKA